MEVGGQGGKSRQSTPAKRKENIKGMKGQNDNAKHEYEREQGKNAEEEKDTKPGGSLSCSPSKSASPSKMKAVCIAKSPPIPRLHFSQVAFFEANWDKTNHVLFHPYESILIACDNRSTIGTFMNVRVCDMHM